MTAMEEAFARVGIHGYGTRQVGRTLHLRSRYVPDPSVPPHNTAIPNTRERTLATIAEIEAMDEDALAVEIIALTQNVEQLRSEIRGLEHEPDLHEPGWRRRAERALAGINARLKLCHRDQGRRNQVKVEQARQIRAADKDAAAERHERFVAASQERAAAAKELRAATTAARDAADALRFVQHAKALLPRETYLSIWVAANAERPA